MPRFNPSFLIAVPQLARQILTLGSRTINAPSENRSVFKAAKGWILHSDDSAPEKEEVMPGLYVSGSQETLMHLLETGFKHMRLILGYAGWSAGQLDSEIAKGAWLSSDVNVKRIFNTDNEYIWNEVLSDMGIDPTQLMLGGGLH